MQTPAGTALWWLGTMYRCIFAGFSFLVIAALDLFSPPPTGDGS